MVRLHPPTPPSPPTPPTPPSPPAGVDASTPSTPSSSSPTADKVRKIIELIRPAIQADGGDIEFVAITPAPDSLVQIRMHGACVGCPSSQVTLQTGIERNLKAHVPEVRGIQVVE